jgi:hypothetical protein
MMEGYRLRIGIWNWGFCGEGERASGRGERGEER